MKSFLSSRREKLLNLFVQSMLAEKRIILLLFQTLWMSLSVFGRRITRRRSPLFSSFCTFKGDDLLLRLCHNTTSLKH